MSNKKIAKIVGIVVATLLITLTLCLTIGCKGVIITIGTICAILVSMFLGAVSAICAEVALDGREERFNDKKQKSSNDNDGRIQERCS